MKISPNILDMADDRKVTKSWRDVLKIHPAALEYPRFTEAELAELGKDIKIRGLQVDVVLFLEGRKKSLIDGVSRLDAIEANGISLVKDGKFDPTLGLGGGNRVRVVANIDPHELALSLNAHRRHLTPEKKREYVEALLKKDPTRSNRAIAEEVKTDHKVVGRARKRLEATGAAPQLEKHTGADGKARPARKPASGPSRSTRPPPTARKAAETATAKQQAVVQALQYVGSESAGEIARLRARVDELGSANRQLNIALADEVEDLRTARKPELAPEDGEPPLCCSFCDKSQHTVRGLIARPPAFICNECVDLCVSIIRENDERAKAETEASKSDEQSDAPTGPAAASPAPPADDGYPDFPENLRRTPKAGLH